MKTGHVLGKQDSWSPYTRVLTVC